MGQGQNPEGQFFRLFLGKLTRGFAGFGNGGHDFRRIEFHNGAVSFFYMLEHVYHLKI